MNEGRLQGRLGVGAWHAFKPCAPCCRIRLAVIYQAAAQQLRCREQLASCPAKPRTDAASPGSPSSAPALQNQQLYTSSTRTRSLRLPSRLNGPTNKNAWSHADDCAAGGHMCGEGLCTHQWLVAARACA
jgi:hypothetical protein